ncbi:phosphatase PAP2 family protein [Aridibaculum aurantiacum]|uniref:phosphatase PAP2 family protein n=1 Tax=Aridibaculum aurantiacum TaxID=2810307 RepID=UPI001A971DAC|nr:phosphatase PAP2 family protein [Aridibaculum aurantiacum]
MYLLQAADNSFFEAIWAWISGIDKSFFLLINNTLTNSFFDSFFPIYRESNTWMPLYLFLFVLIVFNFRWKAMPWILFFIITVSVCDQFSSAFLKEFFGRLRPCRDPDFNQYVRLLVVHCPISGSFTSSHAANHFGMATFIIITLGKYLGKYRWAFWFWAGSIVYGQVYVGVHYPLDVIGGALVGIGIGTASGRFFNRRVGQLELDASPTGGL